MKHYFDQAIDAVQTAKRSALEAMLPNAELQKPFKTYLEAQTSFAKTMVGAYSEFSNAVALAPFSANYAKAFEKTDK